MISYFLFTVFAPAVGATNTKKHIILDAANIGNEKKEFYMSACMKHVRKRIHDHDEMGIKKSADERFYEKHFFPQIQKAVDYYQDKGYHVDIIAQSVSSRMALSRIRLSPLR